MKMSEQGKSEAKATKLDQELENREAINEIMEVYDIDEDKAKELWARFIETVNKMRAVTDSQPQAKESQDI